MVYTTLTGEWYAVLYWVAQRVHVMRGIHSVIVGSQKNELLMSLRRSWEQILPWSKIFLSCTSVFILSFRFSVLCGGGNSVGRLLICNILLKHTKKFQRGTYIVCYTPLWSPT